MDDNYLTETIRKSVGTEKFTADKIGESDSEVRIYDNFVLNIQPERLETDNEYYIVKWLNGRLPVPSIPGSCYRFRRRVCCKA